MCRQIVLLTKWHFGAKTV